MRAAAVVAIAAALAAGGCDFGSDERPEPLSEGQRALARAAQVTPRAGTARVEFTVRSLPRGRIDVRGKGIARLDRRQGRYDFTVRRYPGVPGPVRAQARATESATFIRPRGTERFVRFMTSAAVPTTIDSVLPYLGAVVGPVEPTGEPRTYRATVDLDLVDEQLPDDRQAELRIQVDRFVTTRIPVSFRVDEEGRLTGIAYRVERLLEPDPGEDRGIAYEAELSDFGVELPEPGE